MSYPSGPSGPSGNPGYSSGQPQGQYNAPTHQAPTHQFGQVQESAAAGPSKLPFYLDIGVAALGAAIYLATFALDQGGALGPLVGILAGLLAGVGLVPKQQSRYAIVAVLSVLGFLIVLAGVITVGAGSLGWASYLLIALTLLQAVAAVAALLLDADVITAPTPKPKYEQQHQPYGQYGGPGTYYGQPQHGQPQHGQPPHLQGPQQRGGYSPQHFGGYPGGSSTGGFAAPQSQGAPQQSGPPTPPTGFPAFGQPQGATSQFSAQPSPQTSPQPSSQSSQGYETPSSQPQADPQSTPPPS